MDQQESNNYALDNLLTELQLIKDVFLRNFATTVILHAPGVYWYRPSAFYKGHHPDDELGIWGNLIHVKRCVAIARIFVSMEDLPFTESDVLYSALIVHDIGKYGLNGLEERIQKTHPEIGAQILQTFVSEPNSVIELIVQLVRAHMGRWGVIKPATQLEKLVSYCDCIASRSNINVLVTLK